MTNSVTQKGKTPKKTRKLTEQEKNVRAWEQTVRRRNLRKTIRGVIQYLALGFFVYWLCTYVFFPKQYVRYQDLPSGRAAATAPVSGDYSSAANEFIAVSYSGVEKNESPASTIVSQRRFIEQIQALADCGYVTISQKDIEDYYLYGGTLPAKSMFLLFEDGISDTTALVQDTLRAHNYMATVLTYANNLDDVGHNYLSVDDLKALLKSSYWELGVNGYRLSYINAFDRYENFYGQLNPDEYSLVRRYLKRDYNHYLMDFIRNEDRLRTETVKDMQERIKYDYEQMQLLYTQNFGYLPGCYVLMHSNTGMFGTDPTVSIENRKYITSMFQMNFNRQGSCLNNLEASIYDLTRIQPQSHWYTNHLLMRIKDDTTHEVQFVVTDEKAFEDWYLDRGAVEFRDKHKIVLTSEGYDIGSMALRGVLTSDVDLSVTLEGNIAGIQSIYLRTDRTRENGLCVSVEDNVLSIRESVDGEQSDLYTLDLYQFDGGSGKTKAEDELEGLKQLQNAIVQYDDNGDRIADASKKLTQLQNRNTATLAQGGEPYVPQVDIRDPGKRDLHIVLKGEYITVTVDGRVAVENLKVGEPKRGIIVLLSSPLIGERFSQRNLDDDVYDGVFTNLVVRSAQDAGEILYAYQIDGLEQVENSVKQFFNSLTNFFFENF